MHGHWQVSKARIAKPGGSAGDSGCSTTEGRPGFAVKHGKKSGKLRRRWETEMQRTPEANKQQWAAGLRRLQALPWRRIDVSFRGSSWSTFAHTHIQVCCICLLMCSVVARLLQTIIAKSSQGATDSAHSTRWWTEYVRYALEGCQPRLLHKYHQVMGQGVYEEVHALPSCELHWKGILREDVLLVAPAEPWLIPCYRHFFLVLRPSEAGIAIM